MHYSSNKTRITPLKQKIKFIIIHLVKNNKKEKFEWQFPCLTKKKYCQFWKFMVIMLKGYIREN